MSRKLKQFKLYGIRFICPKKFIYSNSLAVYGGSGKQWSWHC